MKSVVVKSDFKKLNAFIKSMSDDHVVRVGIMGSKTDRKENDDDTNADVGFQNEFGVPGRIPIRSFLRYPLFLKSEQIIKMVIEAGAMRKMAEGNPLAVLTDIGIACESVIGEAFASRGYGTWQPNAPSTIKRKHSDSPLIDTHQLEQSISSVVVKR